MIRHIVMWKLRGPSQEEKRSQAEQAKAALLGMRGLVPGLQQMEVGIGPGSADDEADLVLSSLHDSWQALKDYAVHPDHEPVKRLIGSLRTERRVADFEV
ncbi:MAG TPA: Dabb family protein [Polyangiaceae bacterium]|nr:Dabb family protein [Polyangiaceae bacterium]